ncbi:MAG TPA: hypothetical protein VMW17_01005 [Candidatus Binatia bacterium]|nr:hypothetical protein [Candidatus Binatia bacterium]
MCDTERSLANSLSASIAVALRRSEFWLVGLLFTGAFVYVASFPPNLSASDEGLYLYEAKRIVEGQALYRDIFELVTPAAWYLMAGCFWLFGVSMATARLVTAVIHASITVVTYATCRVVAVRPMLSLAAACSFLALCQPVWPYASPHWLSTLITQGLLLALLRRQSFHGPRAPVLVGVLAGILICVQQQKGVVIGAGVAIVLVVDALLDGVTAARPLMRTILTYALGIVVAVVPILSSSIANAGLQPVVRALVVHPLFNYQRSFHSDWGEVGWGTGDLALYTFPLALKYSPALLPLAVVWAIVSWRRQRWRELRMLMTIGGFAVFSTLSIAYYPDFIHIAFIAPVFLTLLAWLLERPIERIKKSTAPVVIMGCIHGAILVVLALQLRHNWLRSQEQYRLSYMTAFGRVNFERQSDIQMIERVNQLLADVPSRELFIYQGYPSLYLTTASINPTPFQLLIPGYNAPDQFREVQSVLDARRVRYVLVVGLFIRPSDPFIPYLNQHYRQIDSRIPGIFLYERSDRA